MFGPHLDGVLLDAGPRALHFYKRTHTTTTIARRSKAGNVSRAASFLLIAWCQV